MKPLATHLKAAALSLATFFTLASAALLHVALWHATRAPVPYLAATDAGCDLARSRLC